MTKMVLKFSLSGGPWLIGDGADSIYAEVIDNEIPASLITTMWSDKNCLGSVDISLSQISCRFSFVDASADEIIAIQKAFMHDNYSTAESAHELYLKMLEIKNSASESDEHDF